MYIYKQFCNSANGTIMNSKKQIQLLKELHQRHGGFKPKNWNKWFDNVEQNHDDVRKFLGGEYKDISCDKYSVRIETRAVAFGFIGHYGCDDSSCWRQNTIHHHDNRKFALGEVEDSFLILVSNKKDIEFDENNRYLSRSVGKFRNGELFIWNNYREGGLDELSYQKCIKKIQNEFKLKKISRKCFAVCHHTVYSNHGYIYLGNEESPELIRL